MKLRINYLKLITSVVCLALAVSAVFAIVKLVGKLFDDTPEATATPKPTASGYVVIVTPTPTAIVPITAGPTATHAPTATPTPTPAPTGAVTDAPATPTPTPEPTRSPRLLIDAPVLLQDPELPTGCEATSAAMLLQKYGFTVTKQQIADLLPKKPMDADGYGYDPNKYFIGDPYGSGRGCFADVLTRTINTYLATQSTSLRAYDITGYPFSYLSVLLEQGRPIVVWGTMGMADVIQQVMWIDVETETEIIWKRPEHCLLLVGYDRDADTYLFNDPQKGLFEYDAAQFKKIWSEMGSRAVYLK